MKFKSRLKIFIGISILLIAAVGFYYFYEVNNKSISAAEITREYIANKSAAVEKYSEKEINLSGKVKAAYNLMQTRFVIELQNENDELPLFCFFTKMADENQARNFQYGSPIKVRGRFLGEEGYSYVNGMKFEVDKIISYNE